MEKDIADILQAKTEEDLEKILPRFIENTTNVFDFKDISWNQRIDLWKHLYDLASSSESPTFLTQIFSIIRILSRDKTNLNDLISEDWIALIKKHICLDDINLNFTPKKQLIAVEGQKSLCNIIFNSKVAAVIASKNGILDNLVKRIAMYDNKDYPTEIKFFDMKLLFLLTALCSESRYHVINDLKGDECLINVLKIIIKEASENATNHQEISLSKQQLDLLDELFKAIFNLTLNDNDDDKTEIYRELVDMLRILLLTATDDLERTWQMKNHIINLCTNLPPTALEGLMVPIEENQTLPPHLVYENYNMKALYEILMVLQAKFNDEVKVGEQQLIYSPTMNVLLKCASHNRLMRKYLKSQVLPPLKDVRKRPEEGNTVRNRLCKLLTTPITNLRYLVAEFLFVLCKMNVSRMIKYTGYGNAAGLLAQRGLLGGRRDPGETNFSSDSDSETEEYSELKHGINPVLGCYEEPRPSPLANMTEEQKEYEAMKLVKLMDDLTKSGAMKPCRVGADGKPEPIEHILELQEGLREQQFKNDSDSD